MNLAEYTNVRTIFCATPVGSEPAPLGLRHCEMAPKAKRPGKPTGAPKPAKATKTPTKAKVRTPKAATPKAAAPKATRASGTARAYTKTSKVAELLTRPEGCTSADVLSATGWPSVSMPAMGKATGLTLSTKKEGRVTRYWGTRP